MLKEETSYQNLSLFLRNSLQCITQTLFGYNKFTLSIKFPFKHYLYEHPRMSVSMYTYIADISIYFKFDAKVQLQLCMPFCSRIIY